MTAHARLPLHPLGVGAYGTHNTLGLTQEHRTETLPVDDPQVRRSDATRAKQLLGREPELDRREGLRRAIAYYTPNLGKVAAAP